MSLRLVVLGIMGRLPFAGQTWLYLNWLRGLADLGHEVYYVEDDLMWPYDPVRGAHADDAAYALGHLAFCMDRIGLADRWAYRLEGRDDACWGPAGAKVDELFRTCDALLNVGGATELREEHLAAPLRVYVQTDPVILELEIANGDGHGRGQLELHDLLYTYGENFGAPDCGVPLNGLDYRPVRQPIDLTSWPMDYRADAPAFTTIGHYRQHGRDVAHGGEVYTWSKHHQWKKFMQLPSLTNQEFRIAVMPKDPKDRERFEQAGWYLRSPLELSLDVFGDYPEFIRSSRGEFTVAKDQNVRLRSGWFSERDACYLASGKPVVTQDTGFSNILPTGEGLFGVATVEEAAAAVEAINRDYRRHCLAARAIAEQFFDARKVAAGLLAGLS